MFNSTDYSARLKTGWLGTPLIYLEKTDSTNNWLKRLPRNKLRHGTVVLTDQQLAGRGRNQREWSSEPGRNLTFTLALKPGIRPPYTRLNLIPLMAGLATIRALTALYDRRFYLKWPNDIMLSGRKLGGILTETVFYGAKLERVLIGIGLNVNQSEFSRELPSATSLLCEIGSECCREEVLARILLELESIYPLWHREDESLIYEINRIVSGVGAWVKISVNGKTDPEERKFLGIDKGGCLNFMTQDFDIQVYRHEQIDIIDHP